MLKKIIESIMILSVIIFSMNIVNAASGTVSVNANSTSVKPGETFTVTFSAKCEDGINSIDTTYTYDQDKLDFVSANVANNNWVDMGINNTIQVICNTKSKITSDNIYVLTFKVKDNAQVGSTAKVNISDIMVDSDNSASNFTEGAKLVNINIISTNSNVQNNNNGNSSTSTENSNNGQSQNPSTSTENSNNGQSKSPSVENSNNGQNQNGNTQNNNSKTTVTDNSTSNKIIPKTGKTNVALIIFIILASICAVISCIKIIRI